MPVQSLSTFDPTQFFHVSSADSKNRLDTQVSGVAVSNDLSGTLSVTTAEGDKITLTANLNAEFSAASYRSHAGANGTSTDVSAQSIDYSLKKEFNVTVEGDLNQDEIKDLAKLFRQVSNIFKQYFSGQGEAALAKTAKLAGGFGNLSSLAGVDLSVDVQRSVTVVAAQLAAETAGQTSTPAALPSTTTSDTSSNTDTTTPGGAPSTAAAIPSLSSGTTAPTQPSGPEPSATTPEAAHLTVPPVEEKQPKSLVEQVLDAVKGTKVESGKLRKYLPRILDQVREDLQKELRGETAPEKNQTPDVSAQTASAAFFTYQSTRQTSLTLSIHT